MTLIEVMMVISIISIIAALAVPSVSPLANGTRVSTSAEIVAGFLEDARRYAVNQGRCHRVVLDGSTLRLQGRTHSDCFNMDDTGWSADLRTYTFESGLKLEATTTAGPAGANGNFVYRPNSRFYGDGDMDVTDDAGRIALKATGVDHKVGIVNALAAGRICVSMVESAPTFSAASVTCD